MGSEIASIRLEFSDMISDFVVMYELNVFYLQDILSIIRELATVAQPYLERIVSNLKAIQNALVGEGTAFYRAASHTYQTLFHTASSAYSLLKIYVSSAVIEASRQYSIIAGEVVSRLVAFERQFVEIINSIESFFNQHVGQLEVIVMQKVNELRQRTIELVKKYVEDFRPFVERFRTWTDFIRNSFVDFNKTLEGC